MAFIKFNGFCSDCTITRKSGIKCAKRARITCDEDREDMDRAATAAGVTYLNSESFKVEKFCHLLNIEVPGHGNVRLISQYEDYGGYY